MSRSASVLSGAGFSLASVVSRAAAPQRASREMGVAAKAAESEGEGDQPVLAKGGKAQAQHPGGAPAPRLQRPKLPTPHASNLPRRGAV